MYAAISQKIPFFCPIFPFVNIHWVAFFSLTRSHRKTTFLPTLIYIHFSIPLVVVLSDTQLCPFQNNKAQSQNKLDSNQVFLLNLRSDWDPICGKLGIHISFPDVRKWCLPAKPESLRASCTNAAAFLFSGASHRQHIIFIFQSLPWLTELLQGIKHWFWSVNSRVVSVLIVYGHHPLTYWVPCGRCRVPSAHIIFKVSAR